MLTKQILFLAVLLGCFLVVTASADTSDTRSDIVDGWDYSILDTKSEKWLEVFYGVTEDHKAVVPWFLDSYSDVKGADGSRLADVDLDNNGAMDVLTVYEGSKQLFVYLNTWGSQHYNAVGRQQVGDGCGASEEAVFFDFTGNGYPDIVCAATSRGSGLEGNRIYVFVNQFDSPDCSENNAIESGTPSPCWSLAQQVGNNIPHKNWYRIGGDMGSIDFNDDNCPDLAIGSSGGDVGVLWCPGEDERPDPNNWDYQTVWDVDDGEVQRIMTIKYSVKDQESTWLVWSVKKPKSGVYVSRYQPNEDDPTKPGTFSDATQIVDNIKSMEFTIADLDDDELGDLVLPTRNDVDGSGIVRVFFGAEGLDAPWFGQADMQLVPPWGSAICDGLRTYKTPKGVAVGNVWGDDALDIVVMGRGCPYAANGFFYYDPITEDSQSPKREAKNYVWRPLTNQTGNIFQDNEEEKWDRPQLHDMDCDGDLDVVASDEEGDWADTFKDGLQPDPVRSGEDPHDYGVGTLIFWNPSSQDSQPTC